MISSWIEDFNLFHFTSSYQKITSTIDNGVLKEDSLLMELYNAKKDMITNIIKHESLLIEKIEETISKEEILEAERDREYNRVQNQGVSTNKK